MKKLKFIISRLFPKARNVKMGLHDLFGYSSPRLKFIHRLVPLITIVCVCATWSVGAQTNAPSFSVGLSEIEQAITDSTNWTLIGGYGHSLKGKNNLAFGDLAYSFNSNVGLVAGCDDLWASGQRAQANIVKGGVTLGAHIRPFAFIGSTFLTNITANVFASDLLATPKGNSSAIGNIITTGLNFDLLSFKNLEFVAGVQLEKRMGQGNWDGQ